MTINIADVNRVGSRRAFTGSLAGARRYGEALRASFALDLLRRSAVAWTASHSTSGITTRPSSTSASNWDGCYPTVREALRRLGSVIKRQSDRRFELAYFPRDEWSGLVAVSNQARSTVRFADRSGQPRSPEAHLRRLEKLRVPNLAVAGVFGAKHFYPDLDLVGSPRLDLSFHCPGRHADLSFVERLDPALAKTEDTREPVSLVLHFVRRGTSLFELRPDGLLWADPVECLLELHDARLEPQAREFLNSFPAARGKT